MWRKLKSALGLFVLGAAGCFVAIYMPYTAMARGEDDVRYYTLGVFFAPLLLVISLVMLADALFGGGPEKTPAKLSPPLRVLALIALVAVLGGVVYFAFFWFPGEAERFGYRRG